jgi:hypothetical protein
MFSGPISAFEASLLTLLARRFFLPSMTDLRNAWVEVEYRFSARDAVDDVAGGKCEELALDAWK